MRARGDYTERARRLEEVRERNAERIEQKPEIVFDNLTRRQSTFTRRDMAREVFRYIDDGERFRNLMARLEGSPELVGLTSAVTDERGNVIEPVRYTTREMLAVESRMAERAQEMADSKTHGVGEGNREAALNRHSYLSGEQQEAVRFVTSERQIEALTGFAGAGKSAAIAAARDAWQAEGYRVLGGALSGIAAENLQRESGLESRTLASWEKGWREGRERLNQRDRAGDRRGRHGRQPPARADRLGGRRARGQGGAGRRCRAAAADRGGSRIPGDRRAGRLSGTLRHPAPARGVAAGGLQRLRAWSSRAGRSTATRSMARSTSPRTGAGRRRS